MREQYAVQGSLLDDPQSAERHIETTVRTLGHGVFFHFTFSIQKII